MEHIPNQPNKLFQCAAIIADAGTSDNVASFSSGSL